MQYIFAMYFFLTVIYDFFFFFFEKDMWLKCSYYSLKKKKKVFLLEFAVKIKNLSYGTKKFTNSPLKLESLY